MKFLKLLTTGIFFCMSLSLVSCAAGSATAGYALRAREADCLSACGEQRIVDRTKREILAEIYNQPRAEVYYNQ